VGGEGHQAAVAPRAARGEIAPRMGLFDCRRIGGGYMTSHPAGRAFVDRIAAMEGQDGVLSISIGHGFHAADVPEVGSKVLVIADGDQAKADALARRLGLDFIAMGRAGIPPHVKPDDVVATAKSHAGMPVVFADRWDNPGGGVAGDSTFLVHALLAHPEVPAAVGALWDPVAVRFCLAAGPGARLQLRVHVGRGDGRGLVVDDAPAAQGTTFGTAAGR
jgi:microcystin degradation protein MlrC